MKKYLLATLLMSGILACQSQSQEQVATKELTVAGFKEKMAGPNIVILDVRTPAETAQGKIEGALELDFHGKDFESAVDKLDKNKTYLVYCKIGGRSSQACDIMNRQGFAQVYNLKGGYAAWTQQ